MIRLKQPEDGRRYSGQVFIGPKGRCFLSLENLPEIMFEQVWLDALEEDASGNGELAERVAAGVIVVEELDEKAARDHAWSQMPR